MTKQGTFWFTSWFAKPWHSH